MKSVTKSIRLSSAEAQRLAQIARLEAVPEAALLKKWVLAGMQEQALDRAILLYTKRQVSLGEAAQIAGIPYMAMVAELERRGIALMDGSEAEILEGFEKLAEEFELPALHRSDPRTPRPVSG
ncbi:UPF0175 family protein [Caldinitratiruptor microaerophilus]|uniref:Uncharacterized protein n=1 Tax=Caldinitratiruptor microaerophilus TaxID=671077 RepID=A0AA35G9H0_9FIRM|nr:UPF0175 family protein [Caldinitratiruptor microaerophilus]BDG62180.1 hypothetical protein caldi_32700 [Caldinitratiruptor microaerophilus]